MAIPVLPCFNGKPFIDWTPFDKYSENTLTCGCGHVFRSHSKFVLHHEPHIESRKPCPKCNKTDDIQRASSDVERMSILEADKLFEAATGNVAAKCNWIGCEVVEK